MRLSLLFVLAILTVFASCQPRRKRQLVAFACRRDPTLPYCPKAKTTPKPSATTTTTKATTKPPTTSTSTKRTTTTRPTTTTTKPTTTTETSTYSTSSSTTEITDTVTYDYSNYCQQYAEEFYYYCDDINSVRVELRSDLRKHCPIYVRYCDPSSSYESSEVTPATEEEEVFCNRYEEHYHTFCTTIDDASEETQKQLEEFCPHYFDLCDPVDRSPLPMFPQVPTPEPCTEECTADHCTDECKCEYSAPLALKGCSEAHPESEVYLVNCLNWWDTCRDHLDSEWSGEFQFLTPEPITTTEETTTEDVVPVTYENNVIQIHFLEGVMSYGHQWDVPESFKAFGNFEGKVRGRR